MKNRQFINSRDEIDNLLKSEIIGFLGLSWNDEPYIVPVNYAYVGGKIIFHGSMSGKKLDFIRANPNVSFCVVQRHYPIERIVDAKNCNEDSQSVICKGVARIIDDTNERLIALNLFNRRFRPDAEDITIERASRCAVVEIEILEATGRSENNFHRDYWRYVYKTVDNE